MLRVEGVKSVGIDPTRVLIDGVGAGLSGATLSPSVHAGLCKADRRSATEPEVVAGHAGRAGRLKLALVWRRSKRVDQVESELGLYLPTRTTHYRLKRTIATNSCE